MSVHDLEFDVGPISDLEEHKAKERCKEDGFTVPERKKKKKGKKSCAMAWPPEEPEPIDEYIE